MKQKNCHNRLINEKSPYLLQHAHNRVDWYPWTDKAFKKAEREDKPIFLSIGYSTCHWCHVMAHESFEDDEVAELLNDTVISIKVDREERPDIDNIYMEIAQILTGSGGWPLTIIMTHDKKPFWAGTYLPKKSRFGRIGILELIAHLKKNWDSNRKLILNTSGGVATMVKKLSRMLPGEVLDSSILDTAYLDLLKQFDEKNGGFGRAPKFPAAHNISFLLRYFKKTKKKKALEIGLKTLDSMRKGGVYDHVGFGFHRYSTDTFWLVPHFEKMLYDQALLAIAYTEAYQITGKEEYSDTAREIFEYVLRDMTDKEGGFYSAEDADSEGEEGTFYLWSENEIRKVLRAEDADFIIKRFNIKKQGNFNSEITGKTTLKNILHLKDKHELAATHADETEKESKTRADSLCRKLFAHRNKRIRPFKDDKIMADWNGLMIAALSKGAAAFDMPEYAEAANRAIKFIQEKMTAPDGRLIHIYSGDSPGISGYLNDYAFMVWGLIEAYEATFNTSCLKAALDLNKAMIRHFWDERDGGFFFSADDAEEVISRRKECYDSAMPSGNSVAMLNLIRIAGITGDRQMLEKAARTGSAFSKAVKKIPSAFAHLMSAVGFGADSSCEITVVGNPESTETQDMLKRIKQQFLPNKILLFRPDDDNESQPDITQISKFTKSKKSINNKATAYICLDYHCKKPITDVNKVIEILTK